MKIRHYVSQVYFKSFLDPKIGKLAILEKVPKSQHKSINMKPIKYICSEVDFFALDGIDEFIRDKNLSQLLDENGNEINKDCLEDELSEQFETPIGRIIPSIIESQSFYSLTKDQLHDLIAWITWIYIANPTTEEILKQRDPLGSRTSRRGGFISWHDKTLPYFKARTWAITVSEEQLLTSDRPVSLYIKPQGLIDLIGISNATIYFPLSPELLLMGKPNVNRKFEVVKFNQKFPRRLSSFVNLLTYENADQIVLANSNDALNNFRKKYIEVK